LEKIHPFAVEAASATVCAGRQDRFWQIHDALFRAQQLNTDVIQAQAAAIGLNMEAFEECLGRRVDSDVRREGDAARKLGFGSTPTFVIGELTKDRTLLASTVFSGTRSVAEFSKALDAELARRIQSLGQAHDQLRR
jgi:protein-disulfide isomerase